MFIITHDFTSLATAIDRYIALPTTCWLIDARSALYTVLTTGDSTITISDGTTTIGTITITQSGCAVGDVDAISFSDYSVELNTSTPLKISCDATPGAGAAKVTLVFSEYMGGSSDR